MPISTILTRDVVVVGKFLSVRMRKFFVDKYLAETLRKPAERWFLLRKGAENTPFLRCGMHGKYPFRTIFSVLLKLADQLSRWWGTCQGPRSIAGHDY